MAAGAVEVNVTTNNFRPCAVFDGVDDRVACGNVGLETSFTFGCWVKKTGNADGFVRVLDYGARRMNLFFIDGNKEIAAVFRDDAAANKQTSAIDIGENWTRVVVTGSIIAGEATLKIYINNVVATNAATGTMNLDTAQDLFIGSESGTTSFLNGCVSDVCMWDKVLTTDEIEQDYQGKVITDGLIHRWKLEYDYTDSVGTADGTNSGSYVSIRDDAIAAAIKADRTTANDKYLIVGMPGGQVVSAVIEEAP